MFVFYLKYPTFYPPISLVVCQINLAQMSETNGLSALYKINSGWCPRRKASTGPGKMVEIPCKMSDETKNRSF